MSDSEQDMAETIAPSTTRPGFCQRPWLCALRLSGVYFLITLVLLKPFYFTPDDLFMQCTVSGLGVVQTPTEHLLYTHVLIGNVLKGLYGWAPNVDWYPIYLLISLFFSFFVITYCLFRRFPWKVAWTLYSIFHLSVGWHLMTYLQFSNVSAQVSLSGVILFLANLEDKKRFTVRDLLIPLLLCLLGSLIRKEVFLLVCLIILPWALFAVFRIGRPTDKAVGAPIGLLTIKRILLSGLFAITALGLTRAAWNYNYNYFKQSPGWEHYYEQKELLNHFLDFDRVSVRAASAELLKEIGWTRGDLFLINDWYLDDFEIEDATKLKRLMVERPKSVRSSSLKNHGKAWTRVKQFFATTVRGMLPFLAVSLVFFLVFRFSNGRRSGILFILMLLWIFGVSHAIALEYNRLTVQIVIAMINVVFLCLLFQAGKPRSFIQSLLMARKEIKLPVVTLAVSILVFCALFRPIKHNVLHGLISTRFIETMVAMDKAPDSVFVSLGDSIPYTFIAPFKGVRTLFNSIQTLQVSDYSLMPDYRALKKEFGIENLDRALFERENLYLWNTRNPARKDAYRKMIKGRYGVDVLANDISEIKLLGKPLLFQYVKVKSGVETMEDEKN